MTTLVLDRVSRWYGDVVAVNNVSMTIGPGITGLLGPNGAGKSTLITMMSGFLPPSSGSLTLDGVTTWHNQEIYRTIGLVPEREGLYDSLTGWRFVLANARLHGLADPATATRRAIETVGLSDAADREVGTYSKGMKQRIKMATALVHDPAVLLLDEPFNGMDPRQRLHLMELLRRLAAEGRTVLFSSHILEEVEQIADGIQVMVAGRHAASGDFRQIRRLMTERPHQYTIRSSNNRALAAAIIADTGASSVHLVGQQPMAGQLVEDRRIGGALESGPDPALHVEASDYARFVRVLPALARAGGVRLYEVTPADESLESVFSYLVTQ